VLRPSPEGQLNMGLRLAPVEKQLVEEIVEVDGAVDLPPDGRAFASSQVAGKIQRILVDRGQTVSQGEVIAEVASIQLQQVQLELLRAHVDAELLEDALARYRKLDQSQVISLTQLQETESRLSAAILRRDNARRNLETMGLSRQQLESLVRDKQLVELLPIRAPVDGVIVQFDKALGQAIGAEEPLFEVHALSTVWVRAYLSQSDVAKIAIGTPARVRLVAYPDVLIEGKVVRNASMFEQDNRTLSVWVELEQTPPSVASNMLCRVTFTLRQSAAVLAVPRAAIVRQGTRGFVFVRRADGALDRRAVQTGRADDRYVEITTGLKPGEMIAVAGAAELQTAFASIR
jgi:cobalt-zinc-cadmium efflux system membrane fusion protein